MKLYYAGRGEIGCSDAAYALLRRAVSDIYGIGPPVIQKTGAGKPYFPDRPDIHFSLSHTKTHVLCAVSEMPVGADIETVRPLRPGVAARVCTPGELRDFGFFELWVLKESYIKLTGNTNVILKNIAFRREGSGIVTPENGVSAAVFYNIPGCLAAVCSAGTAIPAAIEIVAGLKF